VNITLFLNLYLSLALNLSSLNLNLDPSLGNLKFDFDFRIPSKPPLNPRLCRRSLEETEFLMRFQELDSDIRIWVITDEGVKCTLQEVQYA
jgi:hypothetical protein